jgi:hypothetical protein
MAQDLSRIERRVTRQDRVTTNRDGLIPARNDTSVAPRQINADLRSAQRGDSARQLAEIFGAVDNAAQSFQQYANRNHAAEEEQNASQGLIDQAAGTIDPAMQKKSRAYAEAISTGEAQKGFNETYAQLEADIDERLNDPNDPASPEDIDALISERFTGFGLLDGKPRDFGSLKANRTVAEGMVAARPRLMQKAREVIRAQVEERSISTASANFRQGLSRGDMDFEQAFAQVVPGTDLKKAKAALIDTAQEAAESLIDTDPDKALRILDGLLTSKRKDGSPSLAPDEIEKLRTERRQMGKEVEVAKERALNKQQEANSDKLLDRFNRVPGSGTYPTIPEILKMRSEGYLDANFAGSMIASISADRDNNGRVKDALHGSSGGSGGGDGNSDALPPAAGDLLDKVYSGQLSVGQASAIAAQWAAQGRFGEGKARYKALADLRKNFGIVNSLDKEQRSSVKDSLLGWVTDAKRRVQSSGLRPSARLKAEKEIDDVGKGLLDKVTRNVGRPGYDALGALNAGLRVGSQVLRSKYNIN